MDYEKAYRDALERARNLHKDAIDMDENIRAKQCEIIFPELKESEDEKIRKALLNFMTIMLGNSQDDVCGVHVEDAIAWLEKQGKKAVISHKFNVGDWIVSKWGGIYQIKEVMSGSYNLLCTNNAEEINSITQVDNNSRLLCIGDIKKLEKQGEEKPMKVYRVENEAEQKGLWRKFDGTWQPLFDMLTDGKCKDIPMEDNPIYREGGKRWFASAPSKETLQKWFSKRDLEELVSKGFTISEFEVVGYKKVSDFEYIFTRDNIINRNYLEVSDIYSEQKDFAPKVAPTFKVGDWVVISTTKGDRVVQIASVEYFTKDGYPSYIATESRWFGNGTKAHLWTIQDAKDGDVLANDHHILILKELVYDWSSNGTPYSVKAYCGIKPNGNFEIGKDNWSFCGTLHVHPASKEQRNLLFSKMKAAGYEWDAEKKELKRIEQKDSTEEISGNLRGISPNSKWTEEDEKCIDNCCLLIGAADDCYEKTFKDDCIHYLQSLKERIAWKPEWTDEDEKRIERICNFVWKSRKGDTDEIFQQEQDVNWLKSIKQRIGG